ncbi:hypothetical protein [Clostridium oryzae]|uniref:Uncharacterized protein n=1 Tax=Clostridium oryzae TaxID=1450648 RepID=A0A1V4ITB3_9CLOT|nr:hypothetical protein [Clostridium oryzae]OPJ63252.1 hypothetical protein CLORY_13350 [Clostridium oryzae]
MGFRDKLTKYYQDSYLKKYGDRLTQVRGNVLSVKVEEKRILWIFYKLKAVLIVKPERSRNIVSCVYSRNKWFKKPKFMAISQGNLVIVQGLKPKKNNSKKHKDSKESITIMNILNLTTKGELYHVDGNVMKNATKVKYKYK